MEDHYIQEKINGQPLSIIMVEKIGFNLEIKMDSNPKAPHIPIDQVVIILPGAIWLEVIIKCTEPLLVNGEML